MDYLKDHITIFGGQPPSNLPLQYAHDGEYFVPCGQGTGICFTLTGSTLDPVETAIKNAWGAVLLKTSATGVPVTVRWADCDEDGQLFSIGAPPGCGFGTGLIIAIDGLKRINALKGSRIGVGENLFSNATPGELDTPVQLCCETCKAGNMNMRLKIFKGYA